MDIQELVRAQRTYFDTGATRPYAFRLAQLKKLQQALRDNEQLLEQLQRECDEYYAYIEARCNAEG